MPARQVGLAECRTVVDVLRWAAHQHPEVEAYVEPVGTGRRAMTFGAWDRRADGVAGLLAARGVGQGDVVALLLGSGIAYAVCYAAAQRLGAITTGLNPRMGPVEMRSVLARCRPAATVIDRNLEAVARGTDVLSQPGDRRLSPLPFAHVGYVTRAWDEIAHVVTTVVTPTPWHAAEALRLLEAERITVGQGVPTQWRLVLDRPELERTGLSALRIAGTGAARVPAELVAEMRARLGVPVVVRYTSTESSLGTGTRPGGPDHVVATTVGRPVPGVELQIVDDEGRTVPPGTVGRVRLRSAAAMVGYWAGPAAPGHPKTSHPKTSHPKTSHPETEGDGA